MNILVDICHSLYNKTFSCKPTIVAKMLRFSIFLGFNIIAPLYFIIARRKILERFSGADKNDFIVSFTSFPARIASVHYVVMCLMSQTVLPKKIILWLSKEQFISESCLPRALRNLVCEYFEIRFVEGDNRSYKKFCYLKDFSRSQDFVIVDDDIFYPSKFLSQLYSAHCSYPKDVISNRAYKIDLDRKYKHWSLCTGSAVIRSDALLPTGVGGVYYPGSSLAEVAFRSDVFTTICPNADDIWLAACARFNNTGCVYSGNNEYYLPILIRNNYRLHDNNVGNDENDSRLRDVIRYFQERYSKVIFRTYIE